MAPIANLFPLSRYNMYCFCNKCNLLLQAAGNGERQRMAGANGKPPPSPRKIYEFLNQHIIGNKLTLSTSLASCSDLLLELYENDRV